MASVTALLFCYRLDTLTVTEFKDYCETKHVPFVRSLLGSNHPLTHTRYYTKKDSGFAVGLATTEDPDLIAVITFESQDAMQQSMQARRADGIREQIEADEAKFLDRSKIKLMVLGDGDIGRTKRDD